MYGLIKVKLNVMTCSNIYILLLFLILDIYSIYSINLNINFNKTINKLLHLPFYHTLVIKTLNLFLTLFSHFFLQTKWDSSSSDLGDSNSKLNYFRP